MSPKAKKILIGGALALALLGWRGYDAVKTVKLKEFVEHYNVFINNENRFLTHLNERTDFGSVPEAVMMPVRHSAGFMANFSEYHSVLQEVEKQGLDEARLKQVVERGARTHSIITQVAAKFPSRVQVQSN